MHISGSMTEIQGILKAAEEMRAGAVYFAEPETVLFLKKDQEDYACIKSPITIRESVMLPRSSVENMTIYLKSSIKEMKKHLFLGKIENVTITSDTIQVNGSEYLKRYVENTSFPLNESVENKTKDSISTSYMLTKPYLRLSANAFKELAKQLRRYKPSYLYKSKKSSDNCLRVEGEQLVLYFRNKEHSVRVETGIMEYATNESFLDISYTFSDLSVRLIRLLSKSTFIEEYVFLPRDDFCVIEGYMSGMVAKVRTALKRDLLD